MTLWVRRAKKREKQIIVQFFKKSSPLKLLGQMEPNLVGSIYVRSSIKLLHIVPFGQQTWPLLLKIEHMLKLLKYEKLTDGRRTPSDGNTSHDPLGQVS
jgi:hypothetical protein